MKATRSRALPVLLFAATATLLAACGGGGGDNSPSPPTGTLTLTGTAVDGPLKDAIACYDLNDNGVCDPTTEPTSAPTGADGRWSIVIQESDAGKHGVVVEVPATAVDLGTGAMVGAAFTMRAPPAAANVTTVFVSPLTSLVVAEAAATGASVADATASVQSQLGLPFSPLADFNDPSGGRSAASDDAADAARIVGRIMIEVARLASAAGVPAAEARALIDATTRSNLPAIGALARTPAASIETVAAAAAADTLAARNITATTVVAQAAIAARASAPLVADSTGPFISLRNFTYASASDYNLRVFVGDSSQLDANGAFTADEIRQVIAAAVPQPFNRNQVYWTGAAWNVCEREYQVVSSVSQTASAPQKSTYCGASKSESRITSADISGRRMSEVVAEIRAFPLPDTTGLPTNWGPDPALLGDAVFPAGSALSTRAQVTEVGGTERYALLDKPRVLPAYRHAANFAALKAMSGNIVDPAAVVGNANTVFLDDTPATQTDPALRPLKRHRLGFDPAGNRVAYYECDVRAADNASVGCFVTAASAESEIVTLGNARVLRLLSGYPPAAITALKRQRLFVERDGVVFGGYRDLQHEVHQQRLNTTAWIALRDRLGIPAHGTTAAPPTNPPLAFLRSFTYTDAGNYSYRFFEGSGVPDAVGEYTADEIRETAVGGVIQPFAFNSELWTGSGWYACPNDGIGVLRYFLVPRESNYCRAFINRTTAPVVVTLDGRNMADVLRDIRWYPSKDGVFDYANYGPNPDTTPLLAAGTFPPGSTMYYQHVEQAREPRQVFLGTQNLVRNAPSPTSGAPYDSWPVTTTLEEAVAFNPGNYAGGPLNGNVTLSVFRYFLTAPPDPAYTNEIGYRVAFDANGQRARFFRHNRAVATNFSTNYVAILDTTYTIETLGDYRAIRFVQTPEEILDRSGYARIFVQRAGEVRFGQQNRIYQNGQSTIRLNGVAAEALGAQLGIP